MTEPVSDRPVRRVSRRELMASGVTIGATALASQYGVGDVLAQSGGPSDVISGTVTDGSGGVDGATVVAVPHDSSLDPLVTTTASDGTYSFQSADLHSGSNLYHVIARDGTETSPRRGQQNYPFIAAEGGDAIVLQYFATTWSQGDGTWTDDEGTSDMSITGDPQDGTLSDTSESVNFDGVDDHGAITMPSSLGGSGLTEFSVEIAIQHTQSGVGDALSASQDNTQGLTLRINRDSGDNDVDGQFYFRLTDEDGNRIDIGPDTNPNIDDGNRHDISIIVNDPTTNDVDIIIDGSTVPTATGTAGSPSNFGTWNIDMGVSARNNGGSFDVYLDSDIGAIRWHDEAISSQTISDYP